MSTKNLAFAVLGAVVCAGSAYFIVNAVAGTQHVKPLTIVQHVGGHPSRTDEITSTIRSDGSVAVRTVRSNGPDASEALRRFEFTSIKDRSTGQRVEYFPKLNLKVSTPMSPPTAADLSKFAARLSDCSGANETSEIDPEQPDIFGIEVMKVTNVRYGEECGLLSEKLGRTMESKCVAEMWRAPSLDCKMMQIIETRSHSQTGEIDIVKDLLFTVEVSHETRHDLFDVPEGAIEGPPSEIRRRLAEADEGLAARYQDQLQEPEFRRRHDLQDERYYLKRSQQ